MLRQIAHAKVPAIGLGCMGLSHGYGNPTPLGEAKILIEKALELGLLHFDTASLYGSGANEKLVGEILKPHRDKIFLASKCALYIRDGKRVIDGRPEDIRRACELSLKNLQTEVIDLYYLHRRDREVPIEDSIGTLADLVQEGKIRAIGISEPSAETLRRAHAVAPIAAVQSEYSLASRQIEIAVKKVCREIGAALVSFSPFSRGILADTAINPSDLQESDIRPHMPRFQEPHLSNNRNNLFGAFERIAQESGYSTAQLSLAWVLSRGDNLHTIPGTTRVDHLIEDYAALDIGLPDEVLAELDQLINQNTISGGRYDAAMQALVDTEEFE
ncbi:MAG: aldo/keto reductase [Porticoccaceae bacterium]|jgi:aryl-alcohol dehydrogenase-like predicted oxidoreductase|nr:aldo/keto reductase [Porticoccaceae bacterium]